MHSHPPLAERGGGDIFQNLRQVLLRETVMARGWVGWVEHQGSGRVMGRLCWGLKTKKASKDHI